MTSNRYLTKSRFRLALDCPTRLFYTRKPKEYADTTMDNDFLRALADGGYQVGELAKHYFPGGVEIEGLDHQQALATTRELLKQENVILYEPAFAFEGCFIRVDILVKKGNNVKLIEVKAKSYTSVDEFYLKRRNGLMSEWKPYIYDVAFQKFVLTNAYPEYKVEAGLMLVDKNKVATVDGLNQRFIKARKNGQTYIISKNTEDLGEQMLSVEYLDETIAEIIEGKEQIGDVGYDFPDYIKYLAAQYINDEKIFTGMHSGCKGCTFKLKQANERGLKSGYHECLSSETNAVSLDRPTVFELWNCRKIEGFVKEGRIYMDQIADVDLIPKKISAPKVGLENYERQIMQLEYALSDEKHCFLDKEGLSSEIAQFTYPLHFIDFETTAAAIPFFKGQRAYEQIAFQFSHHTMDEAGRVVHQTQWINLTPGDYPNFEFIRALQSAIGESGTIFRFHNHENTILNKIYDQLSVSDQPDKEALMKWIKTVTHRKDEWVGERDMVDLCTLYKLFHYDKATKGSNSLKAILPAILQRSEHLQNIYSKPCYGTDVMPSLNFTDKVWLVEEEGLFVSPYKQLPRIFDNYERDAWDNLLQSSDELADGGAAMTAYGMAQYTEMTDIERSATKEALLRYCELDTLAMVMLMQYWKEALKMN